jgi:hypothetical protein
VRINSISHPAGVDGDRNTGVVVTRKETISVVIAGYETTEELDAGPFQPEVK